MRARTAQGTVKIWHRELGWGVLTSPDVREEVWAHLSAIELIGYQELLDGDPVEFRYHRGYQDGYRYVADSIHPL